MTADMPNWSKAITLHEWRELMRNRRRNLTDNHPGLRKTDPGTTPAADHSSTNTSQRKRTHREPLHRL